MKRSSVFFVFLFPLFASILPAQGQVPVGGTEDMLDKLRLNRTLVSKTGPDYSEIEGEVFLYPKFIEGSLKISNEKALSGMFRYDMYDEKVEFLLEDIVYTFTSPHLMEYLHLGEIEMIYLPYVNSVSDTDSKKFTYFIEHLDGDCKLLERKKVLMREAEPPKLYQEAKPAQFLQKPDAFYLKLRNEPAIQVSKKKDLVSLLEDPFNDISQFIKKEKISVNKLEDLKKVVEHYNSL